MTRLEDNAAVFKALSDPNRLAILALIRERCSPDCEVSDEHAANTVSEIALKFNVSLSTVSHHIRELKNAGLIRCQKRGQRVHCTPNLELLERLSRFLTS